MSLVGLIRITRPANAVFAGIASVVAYLIATGMLVPAVLLLFAIVALITAAGNVINDYFDIEIDRVNRPDRPIPSGTVTPRAARAYAVTLFLAGLFLCFFTSPLCMAIAIINSVLLALYAAWLKRTLLLGNIAVAYLSGSMFIFGAALAGTDAIIRVIPFAVMTFFAMLARELVKDAEDVEGDRASGAVTLPIRSGIRMTVVIALLCGILAAASSLIPVLTWGAWYLAGILVVDGIMLAGCIRAIRCRTPREIIASKASALLKGGMFVSLVVFVLAAVLL